jgi:hypothetical protein
VGVEQPEMVDLNLVGGTITISYIMENKIHV